MSALDFDRLREVNAQRCEQWHGPGWLSPEDPWTIADWSNAMGGEAGEAANVVKKLRRWQTGLGAGPACFPGCSYYEGLTLDQIEIVKELEQALADELADVVLYADLLAAKMGINLGEAVRAKFNRKSEEQGFEERL